MSNSTQTSFFHCLCNGTDCAPGREGIQWGEMEEPYFTFLVLSLLGEAERTSVPHFCLQGCCSEMNLLFVCFFFCSDFALETNLYGTAHWNIWWSFLDWIIRNPILRFQWEKDLWSAMSYNLVIYTIALHIVGWFSPVCSAPGEPWGIINELSLELHSLPGLCVWRFY